MWTLLGSGLAWSLAVVAAAVPPSTTWKAIAPPASAVEWRCANTSGHDWSVRTTPRGDLLFAAAPVQRAELVWPLPGGGRLVGTNKGESGGAIEWVSDSGAQRLELLRTNPVAFAQYRGDIYIATGPSNPATDRGEIYRMHRQAPLSWQIDKVLDLGEAPGAALADADQWTLVTGSGVTRVDLRTLATTRLHTNPHWSQVHPTSIVLRHGRWYIGARSAVIRLSPFNDAYREEWMVPPACAAASTAACHCKA